MEFGNNFINFFFVMVLVVMVLWMKKSGGGCCSKNGHQNELNKDRVKAEFQNEIDKIERQNQLLVEELNKLKSDKG